MWHVGGSGDLAADGRIILKWAFKRYDWGVNRPVFTHGPPGPGPRAANFQGRHIKKIEIEVRYAEKKVCP